MSAKVSPSFPSEIQSKAVLTEKKTVCDRIGDCLSACWEAIKTFFSWLASCLCCCCNPRNEKKTPNNPLPKRTVSVRKEEKKPLPQTSLSQRSVAVIKEEPKQLDPLEELKKRRNVETPTQIQEKKEQRRISFSLETFPPFKLSERISPKIQFDNARHNFDEKLKSALINATTKCVDPKDVREIISFAKKEVRDFEISYQEALARFEGRQFDRNKVWCVDPPIIEELESLQSCWDWLQYKSENTFVFCHFTLQILDDMVKNKLYPNFTHLLPIKTLLQKIGAKPINPDSIELFNSIFAFCAKNFSLDEIKPITLQDFANREREVFIEKLTGDLTHIFLVFQETLVREKAEEILLYAREELRQFQVKFCEKYGAILKEEHIQNMQFDFPDPDCAFIDLDQLLSAWKKMEKLASSEDTIDDKIKLLMTIARILPRDHGIYDIYPIKEAMDKSLSPLEQNYFSNRTLDVTNDADQMRRAQIESAYEEVKKRLGVKEIETVELEMDCSGDSLLTSEAEDTELGYTVAEINSAYLNNLNNGWDDAIQMAAFALEACVEKCSDETVKDHYIKKILAKLSPEIADAIQDYLAILPS